MSASGGTGPHHTDSEKHKAQLPGCVILGWTREEETVTLKACCRVGSL